MQAKKASAKRKAPKNAEQASPAKPTDALPPSSFPIVGIGASAGGLEAFEQFFHAMPADSGLAFVLVPHLDPDHASLLVEILQRSTAMPVVEATEEIRVSPNQVYISPPNRDMALFHGTLHLSVPDKPRGHRMPIDAFLRSLADDQGEMAVGIILSGTGTDGTLGLRAIVGAGGVALVQEPGTAKYDGMPRSAIQAGYATQVEAPDTMPGALKQLLVTTRPREHAPKLAGGIPPILMLLRNATGHDFSLYKKSTIGRRIERRMAQHDIRDSEVYARYMKEHPAEIQLLFKELLINVTSFFRDPEAFATLKTEILPALCADKPDDYVFRIWVAGCASGEEAYSIAILLREQMDEMQKEYKVQMYATDLDEDCIVQARAAVYPPNIAADVSPERLRRFFVKHDQGYRIKKEIREMVVFAVQNIVKDPPFTKLDLLACRNLMIYLETELQNRLLPSLHYALKPGGVLFLSPSESIGSHPEVFAPLNRKWKFYRAIHSAAATRATVTSSLPRPVTGGGKATEVARKPPAEGGKAPKEICFAELTRRVLLQFYAPASVVTDARGDIQFVHGDTGKYLRPAPGEASLNVIDMARDGLQLELRNVMRVGQFEAILNRELQVKTNGDFHPVLLSVRPLHDPDGQGMLLVSFQELPHSAPKTTANHGKRGAAAASSQRIAELEQELAYTKENLQSTIEAQQASNEELKSANEELQSTNEELQSTNEELETSREELQSVNEEMITVNTELQSKIEQLAGTQNDMKNLLDNVQVGTVFLDPQLNIRRFTRDATQLYRLVATDVGRALADIKSNIKSHTEGEELLQEAQSVLDTLAPHEREVHAGDGKTYLVRVLPYRTLDNVIDGVVMTFTDITHRLAAEIARAELKLAEAIVNTVREPLVILEADLSVISASRAFYRCFKVKPDETVGRSLFELGNGQWDIPGLRTLLETVLPLGESFDDYSVEHEFPGIGQRKMMLNARRILDSQKILLAMEESR